MRVASCLRQRSGTRIGFSSPIKKRRTYICQQPLVRLTWCPPHNKSNISCSQISFNIRQALIEKSVVAKISVRKVRYACKVDNERQPKQICYLHGQVNRMIIDAALRTLHPVDDALASTIEGAIPAHRHPRI